MSNFSENTSPPLVAVFERLFVEHLTIEWLLVEAILTFAWFLKEFKIIKIESATNEVCLAPFPRGLNFLPPCTQACVSS